MKTITVRATDNHYQCGTLYVVQQHYLDVLAEVRFAAKHAQSDTTLAPALRAAHTLFVGGDGVGVLVPRRTLVALWCAVKPTTPPAPPTRRAQPDVWALVYRDKFGNTQVAVPTQLLLTRPVAPAELVNVVFVEPLARQYVGKAHPLPKPSLEAWFTLVQDGMEDIQDTQDA